MFSIELHSYFKNKKILAGSILLGLILLLMITGFFYLPFDSSQIDVNSKLEGPSLTHLLGTDNLGRDVLSRIMVGIRISLLIGLVVMVFGLITGGLLGSFSGYFGGPADTIIMKLVSTQMAFPGILLALMLVAVFNPNIYVTILALCLMSIPRFTRITRSGFIKYKNSTFVRGAKSRGASDLRIMFIHILPNIVPELIVTATLSFSMSILSESGLSYLGLGVQPPHPSFGRMLNDAQQYIFRNPSGVIFPAVFLIILVLSFNLIGDGISEVNNK